MTQATTDWFPTAEQRAASDDPFLGWSTQTLIGVAAVVTPRHEVERWVATASPGVWRWDGDAQLWRYLERDQSTGRMAEAWRNPVEDWLMREHIAEQLAHYAITRADVNWMKS